MGINDFVSCCLGISSKVDDICDSFDIDIEDNLIYETLDACCGKYDKFGNLLIRTLYMQVVDKLKNNYGVWIEEDRFDIFTNGRDSYLLYDCREIYDFDDVEEIVKEQIGEREIQDWWSNLDFEQLEDITGLKSWHYSPDDGCQAYIDACGDWLNQHTFSEQQEICIEWTK